jgi:hypothetical protein
MRKNQIIGLLITVLFISAIGCKKGPEWETPIGPAAPGGGGGTTPGGSGSPSFPGPSNGAFYAILMDMIVPSLPDTMHNYSRMAWFETYSPTTKDGGYVTGNADSLFTSATIFGMPFTYAWYTDPYSTPFASGAMAWKATGNAANAVPAINFTDNNPMPVIANFVVPSTGSLSSSITVSFNFTNAVAANSDQLLFLYGGSKNHVPRTLTLGTTSVTLSAAEIQAVAVAGDLLEIEVIGVKLNQTTVSGKSYYFVKEYALNKYVQL